MKPRNRCGTCRWSENCDREFSNEIAACHDYERADGKRNPEATCGNCPFGYFERDEKISGWCRYEPFLDGDTGTIGRTSAACRHHPEFWAADEETPDA